MTQDEAKAALQFMQRVTLNPAEIQVYQAVCVALQGVAAGPVSPPPHVGENPVIDSQEPAAA